MENNSLIRDVFSPADPNPDVINLLEKAQKRYGKINTFFGLYKNPIGIEIEIENSIPPEKKLLYWTIHSDGSLKMNGQEYVSVPLLGYNIDYALAEIKPIVENQNNLWSHRTSIHVHQNVRDLTIHQLKLLIALYATFENLFFSRVDPIRRGNSYCYPLTDINPEDIQIGQESQKYCAFNFGNSISKYGTVEYRHHNGTGDLKSIRRWIQLIMKLHAFVVKNNPKYLSKRIKELSYTSQYREFLNEVFGASASLFDYVNLNELMNNSVLWAKMYLLLRENM